MLEKGGVPSPRRQWVPHVDTHQLPLLLPTRVLVPASLPLHTPTLYFPQISYDFITQAISLPHHSHHP